MDDVVSAFNAAFGKKIKEYRMYLGLSQEDLACRIQLTGADVTQATISNMESGRYNISAFYAFCLARILNIDIMRVIHDVTGGNDDDGFYMPL